MEQICNKPECTFSQTGQCVLNNNPLNCQDRLDSLMSNILEGKGVKVNVSVLQKPEELERLTASYCLSVQASEELMKSRYCKVVGILGIPGTGKTASLVSLYLLLSHGKLKGFLFKDSKSIMAFEEICRGTRKWNNNKLPEALTVHTELNDDRSAGFLHLKLHNESLNRNIDLLLTDLPGEWTNSLIDSNKVERLNFLKSSERIWITINSEDLLKIETRKKTIHRVELLIDRIYEFLGDDMPYLTFLITHSDKSNNSARSYLENIRISLKDHFKIIEIASFSNNPAILPGTGIDDLIHDLMIPRRHDTLEFWPDNNVTENRQFLQYRNR